MRSSAYEYLCFLCVFWALAEFCKSAICVLCGLWSGIAVRIDKPQVENTCVRGKSLQLCFDCRLCRL